MRGRIVGPNWIRGRSILSSWVGYDTDGRTDIGWWDTLRLRLEMKRLQLARLHGQITALPATDALAARIAQALDATSEQRDLCPDAPEPSRVAAFAQTLVGRREQALTSPQPLLPLFTQALAAAADDEARQALCVARSGLVSHGLALAHTHVRLNAAQIHNAVRQRLGIADAPEDPAHRRVLFGAMNVALGAVKPVAVDFGALLAEQASAIRLMMTIAQIIKHVDGSVPVRFLIAETETGYTLLAALWLARLFGIERHIEISPLFETADALEQGATVLEEALRSPHYRAYLHTTGRLALQFGYSDSGRYVGQLAASYLIERLRLKIGQTLADHGISDVEVILFDTHGESVGRGAHPGSLADRLKYLSPTASRQALNRAGLSVREEAAFQGGDGYLLFGTPELALATITRIAQQTYHPAAGPIEDPVYANPDFAADFFATVRAGMEALVDDAGYAALLGAFGPSLIDVTGSRPAARQADGLVGAARIRHPRELRAIPNNAILQQLGWCANTLQGIGAAAARHPELFVDLRENSRRFHRAMDLASHALAHSDIDVLRAVIATLDPGTWLDRAEHTAARAGREALVGVARALERLGIWAAAQSMFRRVHADHLALREIWPDAPRMATREVLLHALRLALIHRIWLLSTEIADFLAAAWRNAPGAGGRDAAAGDRAGARSAGADLPGRIRPVGGVRLRRTGCPARHDSLRPRARGNLRTDALAVRPHARDRHHHHARGWRVRITTCLSLREAPATKQSPTRRDRSSLALIAMTGDCAALTIRGSTGHAGGLRHRWRRLGWLLSGQPAD